MIVCMSRIAGHTAAAVRLRRRYVFQLSGRRGAHVLSCRCVASVTYSHMCANVSVSHSWVKSAALGHRREPTDAPAHSGDQLHGHVHQTVGPSYIYTGHLEGVGAFARGTYIYHYLCMYLHHM